MYLARSVAADCQSELQRGRTLQHALDTIPLRLKMGKIHISDILKEETATKAVMPECSCIIREFRSSDQEQVRQLYRQTVAANPEYYYRPLSGPQLPDDVASNFSHPDDLFLVALFNEQVVGFCGLLTKPDDRSIASLVNGVVHPDFRGLGIYKNLFQLRERRALERGIHILDAITAVKNQRMHSFLLQNGFEVVTSGHEIPGFVHLQKRLAPQ